MADVVQQSAIGNMTAMAAMFRGIKGGASVASALTSVATNASSLTSTTLPPVIVASQAEKFLNKRRCFVCNRKLGRDKSKDEYKGMRDPTCPLRNDPAAVERRKVKETEFKAWKAANPDSRKPRKKKESNKTRTDRQIKAVVVKALKETNAGGTAPAVPGQAG